MADKPMTDRELALLCRKLASSPEMAEAMADLATKRNKRIAKAVKALQARRADLGISDRDKS